MIPEHRCGLPYVPLVAVWVGSFILAVVGCEVVSKLTGRNP